MHTSRDSPYKCQAAISRQSSTRTLLCLSSARRRFGWLIPARVLNTFAVRLG